MNFAKGKYSMSSAVWSVLLRQWMLYSILISFKFTLKRKMRRSNTRNVEKKMNRMKETGPYIIYITSKIFVKSDVQACVYAVCILRIGWMVLKIDSPKWTFSASVAHLLRLLGRFFVYVLSHFMHKRFFCHCSSSCCILLTVNMYVLCI